MAEERFLITGAYGCVGAWAVRRLVAEGVPVWTYDLPGDPHRFRLVMDDETMLQVKQVDGDITDADLFERVVVENGISHIIHLAALQVPLVRADPVGGARVNVVGTTVVLETAHRHADQVEGLVYASSFAVYGDPENYPPGPIATTRPLHHQVYMPFSSRPMRVRQPSTGASSNYIASGCDRVSYTVPAATRVGPRLPPKRCWPRPSGGDIGSPTAANWCFTTPTTWRPP